MLFYLSHVSTRFYIVHITGTIGLISHRQCLQKGNAIVICST